MKLAGVDLLLPAISLDLKGSSLQALRLGLLLEAFVGQYKAETVGEVLKRFKPAVDTDKVGLWFDTTTRLAGCAVWCEAKVAINENLRQDQADGSDSMSQGRSGRCVVLNYAAAPGSEICVARQIERLLSESHAAVCYSKVGRNGEPSVALRMLRRRRIQPSEAWLPTQNPAILELRRASLMRSIALGQFFSLVDQHCNIWTEPLGQTMSRVMVAWHLSQFDISLDVSGNCDAAITWARPTDPALRKLQVGGPGVWHASDWDEGDGLVIIDSLGSVGALAGLVSKLQLRVSGECPVSSWRLSKQESEDGRVAWNLIALNDQATGSNTAVSARHQDSQLR